MPTRDIERSQWPAYLDALSRRLQGIAVTVETADGRADDVEFPERGLPLVGITYDEKDAGGSVNIILGDDTHDHITHTVTRPVHLYHKEGAGLISDEINAGEVLEITSQDAPHHIPAFRAGGMRTRPAVAVLALQGDYARHLDVLTHLGANAFPARLPEDIRQADALVLPGGESTAIGKMMARYGVDIAIQDAARAGKPIYGTCAGLILLAREIEAGTGERGGQPTLGLLDVVVARNAFGRQVDSFEASLDVSALGAKPLRAVFIRAPYVTRTGPDVETLATHEGKIVYVRQGNVLGSAFHPELTDDPRAHELFLSLLTE